MAFSLKPISEQVIIITGGSSGNGLATAREAVRRGASVVLAARNGEALARIARDLSAASGKVLTVEADVASMAAVEKIAQAAIDGFGGFDSWINNAGTGLYGTLEQVPLEDHRRTFDVNYFGTLHGSLVAARHLRHRGGGAIINVGSILGDRAIIEQGPYSATKHAVQALTDTLRMELQAEGAPISVTLIKPGGCGTPYAEHARNYMDTPPRIPQPLYHPAIIADAVLHACAHPKRTIYIGGGGIVSAAIGQLAPRLTDKVMQAVGTSIQQSRVMPGDPAMRDNLYHPKKDGCVETTQGPAMRHTSLAVAVQKAPLSKLCAAVVAMGLAAWLGRGLLVGSAPDQPAVPPLRHI